MSHWSWFSCTHWPVDKQQAPLSPAPRGSRPASEPDSCAMAVPTGQANEAHKATIITIRCIPHPRTFPGPTTPHPRDAGARVHEAIFSDISALSTVTYELIHIFFTGEPPVLPEIPPSEPALRTTRNVDRHPPIERANWSYGQKKG